MVPLSQHDVRSFVPATDGVVLLRGLESSVSVLRDRYGVPHARASSLHDAFFAQGFVHAQDRFWHMDADRMRASGRWSEYIGRSGLEQDTLVRKLGLGASAQRDYEVLDSSTRDLLQAYASGVNAFLDSVDQPSVEHALLEVRPERWQPWHSGAIHKFRHHLMGSAPYKLWRARVLDVCGEEWLSRLASGAHGPQTVITDVAEADGGSNNWVVSGRRTASGAPLVAGDPHRAIDVPNVYYQNHISCPDFDAIGLSFPGVPGWPHFGHNASVSWCVTHAMIDNQDLFVERFAGEGPSLIYQIHDTEWRHARIRRETICVKGEANVSINVIETRHGPVVLGDPDDGQAIVFAYSALAPDRTFDALLPMLRAQSVDDLEAAMRTWVEPANNLVMADVHGCIAYLTRGQVPVRDARNGWLPVPGSDPTHEWLGVIPFEQMPRLRNPSSNHIVTANNRIVGNDFPYYLSNDWAPAWRAQRIGEVLEQRQNLAAEDMPAIHAESLSSVSRTYVDLVRDIAPLEEKVAQVRRLLLDWDGRMAPESAGAAAYAVWREMLNRLLIDRTPLRELADAANRFELLPDQAIPVPGRLRAPLQAMLARGDISGLPPGETWSSLGAQALRAAADWLFEHLGNDAPVWRWDQIHRIRPRHLLSGIFAENSAWLDPPPAGMGGDADTPLVGAYRELGADGFTITTTAVARYCFDLADWDSSGWVVPLGVSGHPGSPHYTDQLEAWLQQRLLPMTYSWESVEAQSATRQELINNA
jgi:penicillin G amidase